MCHEYLKNLHEKERCHKTKCFHSFPITKNIITFATPYIFTKLKAIKVAQHSRETTLEITTLINKKRDYEDKGGYILKDMHCIWFNINFEVVLAYDLPFKRKGGGICIGEHKPRNGKDHP